MITTFVILELLWYRSERVRGYVELPEPSPVLASIFQTDPQLISIFYASNRAIDTPTGSAIDPDSIGYQRSTKLTFGAALVRVPEEHKIGRVERPFRLKLLGISIVRDPDEKAHFVIKQIATLSRDQFSDAVRLSGKKSAFIFVHGYWNSFSDAIFRLAQIVYDTNISAVPVAFCWPSMRTFDGYGYDRDSAVLSKGSFAELLELLHKEAGITSIYVVAHSMGNQIVADMLAYARLADIPLPVSEIAFAAPDVDQDVFSDQVKRIKDVTPGIGLTLYASKADKLLKASKLQSSRALVPRAGDVPVLHC
jgi:esterase/lipase superfamily enzyme